MHLSTLFEDFVGIDQSGKKVSFVQLAHEDFDQETAIDPRLAGLLLEDKPESLILSITRDSLSITNPNTLEQVSIVVGTSTSRPTFVEVFRSASSQSKMLLPAFDYIDELRASCDRAAKGFDISMAFVRLVSRLGRGQS